MTKNRIDCFDSNGYDHSCLKKSENFENYFSYNICFKLFVKIFRNFFFCETIGISRKVILAEE